MKTYLLLACCAIAIVAVAMLDPIPQDPAYHAFADDRPYLGIPNFWNVVTNLPFAFIGAAGLWYLVRRRLRIQESLTAACAVFFIGVLLTAFGSAWYHLSPDNNSLVWDRLPMTLAFMAFFCIVIGDYVSHTLANRLLAPLLLIGVASVVYWNLTELRGAGDLRLYALVQFLPMLLIPGIVLTHRPAFGKSRYIWGMLGAYLAAKVFEYVDVAVFNAGIPLSGHALKHLFAALAAAIFLYGLMHRMPSASGTSG